MEKGQLARALYTNTPESKYELYFRKGDILTILEYDPDGQTGWWLCALRGERGLCPGNYLELVENRFSMSTPVIQIEDSTETEKHNSLESALDTYDFPRPSQSTYKPDSPLSKTSPLDLYDVPRSQLPIYATVNKSNQLRNQNSSLLRTPNLNATSSSSIPSTVHNNKRTSDLSLLSNGSSFSTSSGNSSSSEPLSYYSAASRTSSELLNKVQPQQQHSMDDSCTEENPEYDVPRPSSRVQSSMSGSMFSIATTNSSDPHDDQIDVYDVPRPSTTRNNVSRLAAQYIEKKYDKINGSVGGGIDNNNSSRPVLRRSLNNNNARFKHHYNSLTGSLYGGGITNTNSSGNKSLTTNSSTTSLPHLLNKYSAAGDKNKRNGQMLGNGFNILQAQFDNNELYDVPPPSTSFASCSSSRRRPSVDNLRKGKSSDSFENFCEKATADDLNNRKRSSLLFKAAAEGGAESYQQQERGASFSSINNDNNFNAQVKMLPLNPKSAVSICEKLRQEVLTSINSILMYVKPRWREKENMIDIMPDVRFGCVRLNLAIKDLTAFCSRTVSNANKLGTEVLSARLQRLLTPLIRSSRIIERDVEELEAYLWSVDRLSHPDSTDTNSNDALDQLVLCAQSLSHDVTEMANFLALNSSTLFRDDSSLSGINASSVQYPQNTELEQPGEEDYEDCDYVSLAPMTEALPKFPSPIPASRPTTLEATQQLLDSNDSQLIEFYATQIAICAPLLSQSISSFITSVQQNDSPKQFNSHLKYVILLAYKMLFVGDTVHSNITNVELKEQIHAKSDDLHKAILALHEASKQATIDFPKIQPMQAIIDHVWQTTATANQLKSIIFNANCL